MLSRSVLTRASVTLAAALLLSLPACDRSPDVRFVADGGDYTMEEAQGLAEGTEVGAVGELAPEELPEARRRALVALRRRGATGSEVADLLTRGFPADTRAVPVHVEAGALDGRAAWIVVEAWGETGKPAKHRRLWVFDREDGGVLGSATVR